MKQKNTTNVQQKFSKQSLAENETNNTVKKSILNNPCNHGTNRNRSSEASKLQATDNHEKVTKQNKNEISKKEIESIKKIALFHAKI